MVSIGSVSIPRNRTVLRRGEWLVLLKIPRGDINGVGEDEVNDETQSKLCLVLPSHSRLNGSLPILRMGCTSSSPLLHHITSLCLALPDSVGRGLSDVMGLPQGYTDYRHWVSDLSFPPVSG